MKVNWEEHIVRTPDVVRNKPRIKGTRIPVSFINKVVRSFYTRLKCYEH